MKSDYAIINSIVKPIEKGINNFLSEYGLSIKTLPAKQGQEFIDDMNVVGTLLNSAKTDIRIGPVALNAEWLREEFLSYLVPAPKFVEELHLYELKEAIMSTLWHEAGHHVAAYLRDQYNMKPFRNMYVEELVVEHFARYRTYLEMDIMTDYRMSYVRDMEKLLAKLKKRQSVA